MKKYILPLGMSMLLGLSACDTLEEVANAVLETDPNGSSTPALTNDEVISGLKEALNLGIKNSVDLTSVTDGFLGNADIRLPFPPDAIKVKEKALEWGLDGKVEEFETTLNRAAEEATKEALPIFKDAILGMTISDGFSILNGGDGAATNYLRDKTTTQLVTAFSPKVDAAIQKVKLTQVWEPIITKYNTFANSPLSSAEPINPDLGEFVTDRAVKGLFFMVEKEENKIRKDPIARVTDILKKVFGSVSN